MLLHCVCLGLAGAAARYAVKGAIPTVETLWGEYAWFQLKVNATCNVARQHGVKATPCAIDVSSMSCLPQVK